jgi:hypothetical protein
MAPSNIGQQDALTVRDKLGDDILACAYLQLKSENLLPALFWEKQPSLIAFLEWCNKPDTVVVGCYKGPYLAGIGIVSGIKKRGDRVLGDASEVWFRAYQSQQLTVTFASMLLKFAFEEIKVTDLFGVTPLKNIPAIRFLKLMGFEQTAPVPNLCVWMGENCSGVLSWLNIETWQRIFQPPMPIAERPLNDLQPV